MPDKAALTHRFQALLKTHTQAEVARKTGHSLSNVNRYATGTRLPGDFCGDLIKSLGVNPAWLMAGEGAPYVSDITAGTQRMAGDMLELVEAMNVVARMRLGALSGKHHLRVLRELNDALARYETLRARLNEHSTPIFRQLLQDLRAALKKLDLERALELRKAALQVARLCDEEELSRQLTEIQAQIEFLGRNIDNALVFQRKLALGQLVSGKRVSDETCESILRYCLALRGQGRADEALRIAGAALALVGEFDTGRTAVHELAFQHGRLRVETGSLREGLAEMQAHVVYVQGRRRVGAYAIMLRAMLMAGLIAPEAGFEFVPGLNEPAMGVLRAGSAEIMLEFACFKEDSALLQRAIDYVGQLPSQTPREIVPSLAWPRAMQRALARKAKASDWSEAGAELATRARTPRLVDALEAQFHRLRQDKTKALACHRRAQAAIEATPAEITLDQLWLAIHHRNALALIAPDERDKQLSALRSTSQTWLAEQIKRGYVTFSA
jgi:hypothetical protein